MRSRFAALHKRWCARSREQPYPPDFFSGGAYSNLAPELNKVGSPLPGSQTLAPLAEQRKTFRKVGVSKRFRQPGQVRIDPFALRVT